MKYLVHRSNGVMVRVQNLLPTERHIEITDAQAEELISKLNDGYQAIVKDGLITYEYSYLNKRKEIVEERNKILTFLDIPYSLPDYRANVLTQEQADDLDELRERLRNAPQHYNDSLEKESWQFRWVPEYTSGKNTEKYQLKRLDFVKWKM